MRQLLGIAAAAAAMSLSACVRPAPPPHLQLQQLQPLQTLQPQMVDTTPAFPMGPANPEVGFVEIPVRQAEFAARSGSDSVHFAPDDYSLSPTARATLAAQARWLMANPGIQASIEGHAHERGTREYSIALGERRANAARDFLITQGVLPARLTVISWGKERPVALGSTEPSWAQNRRVVTVLVR